MEKMRQLSISLTEQQHELVWQWATESDRTVAQVIRGLIMREAAQLAVGPVDPRDFLGADR